MSASVIEIDSFGGGAFPGSGGVGHSESCRMSLTKQDPVETLARTTSVPERRVPECPVGWPRRIRTDSALLSTIVQDDATSTAEPPLNPKPAAAGPVVPPPSSAEPATDEAREARGNRVWAATQRWEQYGRAFVEMFEKVGREAKSPELINWVKAYPHTSVSEPCAGCGEAGSPLFALAEKSDDDDQKYHDSARFFPSAEALTDVRAYKKTVVFSISKVSEDGERAPLRLFLVVIGWGAGQRSPIHDHPDDGCLLKVVQGAGVSEVSYHFDKNALRSAETADPARAAEWHAKKTYPKSVLIGDSAAVELRAGDVGFQIGQAGLHTIANTSVSEATLSLHHYIGNWDPKAYEVVEVTDEDWVAK